MYLQNLPVVSWVHLIGVDFLDGGRESGTRLVGSGCQRALDVWDVRRLEGGIYSILLRHRQDSWKRELI